jgi:hypothetical protein
VTGGLPGAGKRRCHLTRGLPGAGQEPCLPPPIDPGAGVDGCQVAKVRPGGSRDICAGHITIARVFVRGGSRISELPAGHEDDARAGRLPPGNSPAISVQGTTPRVRRLLQPPATSCPEVPRGVRRKSGERPRILPSTPEPSWSSAVPRHGPWRCSPRRLAEGFLHRSNRIRTSREHRPLSTAERCLAKRPWPSPSGWHLKSDARHPGDDLFRRRTRARPFSKWVAPSPRGCHLKRAAEIGARSFRKGACRPPCPSALEGLSRSELRASERPPVSIRAPERSGARLVTLQVSH